MFILFIQSSNKHETFLHFKDLDTVDISELDNLCDGDYLVNNLPKTIYIFIHFK